jgi:hypothetical protein
MTNVGRATQGTGGADQPAPTDGAAHSERVEAGSHATPQGESPALQDAPQKGSGRSAAFSVSTPADNADAKAHLTNFRYTAKQLARVEAKHGSAGLEALRRAHGKLPAGSSSEEALALRERLLAIACRKDGMTVLNALSEHGQMLSKVATAERILDVAERPQGATDLVTLAGTHRALADDIRQKVRDAARPH